MKLFNQIVNLLPKNAPNERPHHHSQGAEMSDLALSQASVYLDLANLLCGESAKLDDAERILATNLPLIERCCFKLWGGAPRERCAFSLSSIEPQIHELLRSAGYVVFTAEAQRSETMLIEAASKRDDYLLKREVKRAVQSGARDLLIVSGDRDFESLPSELAVFGPKFHFVQRQQMPPNRSELLTRYESLKDFEAHLGGSLERRFRSYMERGRGSELRHNHSHSHSHSHSKSPSLNGPRLRLEHWGRVVGELELFSGFKVGRSSERAGRVDLCLNRYDRQRDYSRELAYIYLLGDSWVLWRAAQDKQRVARQPLSVSTSDRAEELIGSGQGVVLQAGDLINFERCGLSARFVS